MHFWVITLVGYVAASGHLYQPYGVDFVRMERPVRAKNNVADGAEKSFSRDTSTRRTAKNAKPNPRRKTSSSPINSIDVSSASAFRWGVNESRLQVHISEFKLATSTWDQIHTTARPPLFADFCFVSIAALNAELQPAHEVAIDVKAAAEALKDDGLIRVTRTCPVGIDKFGWRASRSASISEWDNHPSVVYHSMLVIVPSD